MKYKVAVYTGDLGYSTARGILAIVDSMDDIEVKIFVNHTKIDFSRKLSLQWKNLKKNGVRRVVEVFTIAGSAVYKKLFHRQFNKWGCEVIPDYISEVEQHKHVDVFHVTNINSAASVEEITTFAPDLGVSIASPILKKEVLNIAKMGNLNLHKGKLPGYRGMPSAFWEIKNGESSVGCSIHEITELLDEGDVILEDEVAIEKWSTPIGLRIKLDELGIRLMSKAVVLYLANDVEKKKQKGESITYFKPTIKESSELLLRQKHKDSNPPLKRVIKSVLVFIYSNAYAPVRSYIKGVKGKQDIVVLLYHRVNDFQRDSLTVGVEQFNEQMAYVNENFPVASLKSLISGEISRYEKKPIIVVTFDDGYLDNYENAYPICVRNNIPCSFFVSTSMIDEGKPFPHDSQLDIRLYNMDWDQLKEMKKNGMYIGSHTCDHVDCAQTTKEDLTLQLDKSQEMLNEKLGKDVAILAYPFGGKQHFSEEAKDLTIAAGYKSILSAYGGVNKDIDILNIKRGGVDWMFNQKAFIAKLYGWISKQ